MNQPATDRARLVGAAYATPGPLAARAALYQYQDEPLDFVTWVLDLAADARPLDPRSRALDVGCGPGNYLRALRNRVPAMTAIGFDLSRGMASAAQASGSAAAVADAMQLPARTGHFDLVICAHMLYHVPDIELAARELARVVAPEGIVAVVTNGARHLHELDALTADAIRSVTGSDDEAPPRSAARFLLDNAPELIAPALRVVQSERVSRTITVPQSAPITAYVESERSLFERAIPLENVWTDVVARVDAAATAAIARTARSSCTPTSVSSSAARGSFVE